MTELSQAFKNRISPLYIPLIDLWLARKMPMHNYLDFEKPIADLEGKIEELCHLSNDGQVNIEEEVTKLQAKVEKLLRQTYAKLSPWQKTQIARHPDRPHAVDYIKLLIDDLPTLLGTVPLRKMLQSLADLGGFVGHPLW